MISQQCEIDVTEAIDCAFELLAIEKMDAHIQEQLESGELDHEFAAALVDHQWIGRGVRLPEWVTLMRTLGPGSRPVEHMWKAAFAKLDTDSSGALPKDQFAKVFKWCAYGCRQHSTYHGSGVQIVCIVQPAVLAAIFVTEAYSSVGIWLVAACVVDIWLIASCCRSSWSFMSRARAYGCASG